MSMLQRMTKAANDNSPLEKLSSSHEEADCKMLVHLHHGVKQEIVIKAAILENDIFVIVIGIGDI